MCFENLLVLNAICYIRHVQYNLHAHTGQWATGGDVIKINISWAQCFAEFIKEKIDGTAKGINNLQQN